MTAVIGVSIEGDDCLVRLRLAGDSVHVVRMRRGERGGWQFVNILDMDLLVGRESRQLAGLLFDLHNGQAPRFPYALSDP